MTRFAVVAAVLVLAGCTTASEGPAVATLTPTPSTVLATDATTARPTLRIAATNGLPRAKATQLLSALRTQAAARGYDITTAGRATRTWTGYFTALDEGDATTVTFYWDVAGAARINGFERIRRSARGADPWSAVDDATLARIAQRSVAKLPTAPSP